MNKKLLILHTRILFFIFFIFSYSVSLGQTTLFQYNFEGSPNPVTPNINNTVTAVEIAQNGLQNLQYANYNSCGTGNSSSLGANSWNSNNYWRFAVNTTGFANLTFSYCNVIDRTSDVRNFDVRYSVDNGSTITSVSSSSYVPTTGGAIKTVALPSAADNEGSVFIYIYKTNNTSDNNTYLVVDNITLTGYVLPKITSFTPTNVCEGAGAKVIITGVNFTGATAVKFNGVAASSFSVDISTQITAQLTPTATTGAITVTTPSGVITSGTSFVVNPLPVITSLTNSSPSICSGSGGSSTLTASSSSSSPAPVTIVNYDFNSGTSYANLTPVLASGITSVISTPSSGDFSTGFKLASNGTNTTNAFTPNTNSTNSLHGETHKRTWIFTISGTNLALYKTFKLYFQYKMISTDGKQKLNISYSKNGSSTDSPLDTYVILASGNWYESILDLTTVADNATSLTITITSEQGGPSAKTFIDNFQIQAIPSNLSYSWTASPSATAGLPSGAETASVSNSSIVVKPTATTAYTVTTTSFGNCIASKTTTVTVSPASRGGIIDGSSTVCPEVNTTVLTLRGISGSVTKWQSSTSSTFASEVTDILNTTATYTASNLNKTTYYRAVITNGVCVTENSTIATITIKDFPTILSRDVTPTDCNKATGSVYFSGLPKTGQWNLYQNGNAIPIKENGEGEDYKVLNLAVGTYTFTLSDGECSVVSGNVFIQVKAPIENTWTGTTWSQGTPDGTEDLIFDAPPSTTTFTTDISGCSCQVKAGTKVIFEAGTTLKIVNEVIVDPAGFLTFENNASLFQINELDNNSGNISYNRITTAVRSSDYTYWSSPVNEQTFLNAFPNAGSGRLYSFNAFWTPANWEGKNASSTMDIGKGYIVQVPIGNTSTSYDATFMGMPNNGVLTTAIGPKDSFNLIGNPYPSALDADALLDKNTDILNGTLYFWTHNTAIAENTPNPGSGRYAYTSDDYATYNGVGGLATTAESHSSAISGTGNRNIPTGYIAAGQSFFVSSKKSGAMITFNNSMRVPGTVNGNNSQFFKINSTSKADQKIEKHRIWLNLTNTQGAFKQTLVGYVTGATNEYDSRFDGESFNANVFVNFYSVNQNTNWSIQGRALPFDTSDLVSLGYSSNIAGDFTISIAKLDGVLTDQPVFLEDKLTNTVFDLKSGDYTFTTAIGVFNDRFILSYTNKTLGTEDFTSMDNEVLVSNANRQIQIMSTLETLDKVTIYDITGRQLYAKTKLETKELQITNLAASHQVLLIKVSLQNGQEVVKKIVY